MKLSSDGLKLSSQGFWFESVFKLTKKNLKKNYTEKFLYLGNYQKNWFLRLKNIFVESIKLKKLIITLVACFNFAQHNTDPSY